VAPPFSLTTTRLVSTPPIGLADWHLPGILRFDEVGKQNAKMARLDALGKAQFVYWVDA
jgi:hypothetical protein